MRDQHLVFATARERITIPPIDYPYEDLTMTGDRNIALPLSHSDAAQIWIIGTRDQVVHLMNEFTVKRMVGDRTQFTPIVPAPFAAGKYMTVLLR